DAEAGASPIGLRADRHGPGVSLSHMHRTFFCRLRRAFAVAGGAQRAAATDCNRSKAAAGGAAPRSPAPRPYDARWARAVPKARNGTRLAKIAVRYLRFLYREVRIHDDDLAR